MEDSILAPFLMSEQHSTPQHPKGVGVEPERGETLVKIMKRQLSQDPNIPENQSKLLKLKEINDTEHQQAENVNKMSVDDEEDHGRSHTAEHDASWDEIRFENGRLVDPTTQRPKPQPDAISRELAILNKLKDAPTATALRNLVNDMPPAHATPKILTLLLTMMGPLIQCHHCDGRSTTQWEVMGPDGRSKCRTVQKSDMDRDTPCPGRLTAAQLWMVCIGKAKTPPPPELKTVFRHMFSTPHHRKPPTSKVDIAALERASAVAIANLLRTPTDTLPFKEVQKIINTQEALIIGLREHNTQLVRGFKQLAQDFHSAKATSAELANNQTARQPGEKGTGYTYAATASRRPPTKVGQALLDIAKLAETEQAAAYQTLMSTRRNPVTNQFLGKKTSAATRAPLNIEAQEEIQNSILRDKVRRMIPVRVENFTPMAPSEARKSLARVTHLERKTFGAIRRHGRLTEFLVHTTEDGKEAEVLQTYFRHIGLKVITEDLLHPDQHRRKKNI
ncbi:hypothetical protein BC829DRAFT_452342 [Chytridium lagenaria]|nr:hypothetical protein BC829DRAFT_452342 [Chytridium lagenaria]